MSEMDTEPPPAEDGSMSDPAFSAFLTKQLCMHGGRLLIVDIPSLVGLTPEHIAGILREEEKRFPEPEPGTVMVQSPVRLCSGYLADKCQAADCGRLHLCRYFILGHCFIRGNRNGRFCKFSHNIHSNGNRAVLKANEINGLNEKELRVLLQLNDPSCLPEVCYDYKGGKNGTPCPKGEECRRLHVCQHFVKGQCRYFKCNRSHNLLDDITIEVMKVRGLSKEMTNNIQILRIHQCNEARKEPWKDERPKGNKDHPRSRGDRNNERRDSRPQTPDTDGSEVQDVLERTSSESSVSRAQYKSSAPSSRNQRGIPCRPKSASPLPHPTNTVTTYPSTAFLPKTQPTNNSDAQTALASPTKSNTEIPTAAPRFMDPDVEKLLALYMKGYKTATRESSRERPCKEIKKPLIPVKPLFAVTTTDASNPAITFGTGIPLSAKHDARLSAILPPQVTTTVKVDPLATASIRADPANKGDIHIPVTLPSPLNTNNVSLPGVMAKTGTQPTNKSCMPTSVDTSPPKAKDINDLTTSSGINMPDRSKPPMKTSVDREMPSLPMCTKKPVPSPRTSSLDTNTLLHTSTPTPTMPTESLGSVTPTVSGPPTLSSINNKSYADRTNPVTVSPPQTPHPYKSPVHPSPAPHTPVSRTNGQLSFVPVKEYSPRAPEHRNEWDSFDLFDDTPQAPAPKVFQPLVRPVVSPEDCGDPNEICFYHIWAFCQRKSECPQMHYHLPYRWQIEKAPGVWEDLPWMEDIEKAYSDPDNASSGRHDVNFEKMISSYHQVRRLSTASSVTQPPDHQMTTEWVWHWKNEHGKWIEYGKHGGKEKSTIAPADLETIYLADKKAVVPFQAGSQRYQINFKDMIQKNLIFGTEKDVRRRPRFVSKEDVDKLKPSTRSKGTANQPASSTKGIPGYWDSTAVPDVGYKLVEVSKHSMEFKEIEKSFKKTMPQHSISKVERIQNITLWNFYQMQKDTMKKQNNKEVLEKQLFHGTKPIYLDGICHHNFDWRVCGLNGTVYGKGSYFARDASYSHNYCNSNSTSRTMFLARILVGDFVNGDASYTRPPSRPCTKNTFYDSCVDKCQDPSIFVIFDKPQIYPEYIIEYAESKSCCIC
ncbi:zinc finger CCCH-type antiviral protein 1-like [Lissotriton helveticus]